MVRGRKNGGKYYFIGYGIQYEGVNITAGQGTKTYDAPQTPEQIAKDFQKAGTDSVTVGGVVVSGSTAGSTSGGWTYTQSTFGAAAGFEINVSGRTLHTETTLVNGYLKVKG